jgi:hypothetical protein
MLGRAIGSQFFDIVLLACAVALLYFLCSPAVRDELSRAETPLPPRVRGRIPILVWVAGLAVPLFMAATLWVPYVTLLLLPLQAVAFPTRILGYAHYLESVALLIAGAVALWTLKSDSAKSRLPRDERSLMLLLQTTLIAFSLMMAFHALVYPVQPRAQGAIVALVGSFLWPAIALVALFWLRPTRALAVALAGAFGFVILFTAIGAGNPAGFFIESVAPTGGEPAFVQWLNIFQVILIVTASVAGVVAAWRVLFSYAGRLPTVDMVKSRR